MNMEKDFDKIIKDNYSVSFMNNTKWNKLIEGVTVALEMVYNDVIKEVLFYMEDYKPFFIEPILYKEVEWIEFPIEYQSFINGNNLKVGKRTYKQDLKEIKITIDKIGEFKIDEFHNKIRLYAYM